MTTQSRGRPRIHDLDATHRVCNTCQESKPVAEFPPNYTHKGYLSVAGRCRVCKELVRKAKTYGITVDEYQSMLTAQNRACAICKEDFTDVRSTHTDHCHTTGKVRGILCGKCNAGLGMFRDNPDYLRAAIDYLA